LTTKPKTLFYACRRRKGTQENQSFISPSTLYCSVFFRFVVKAKPLSVVAVTYRLWIRKSKKTMLREAYQSKFRLMGVMWNLV